MKGQSRRSGIVDVLVATGSASVDDLASRFDVSRMTIHRDLDALEAEGLLRKIRGGATVKASQQFMADFSVRRSQAIAEKRRIAVHALQKIEPGDTIVVDDGSTAAALGEVLMQKQPLTIITNNMSIIQRLSHEAGIHLIALGGTYSRKFNGFFGLLAESAIQGLRADVAFISCSAVHGTKAFHQDQEVVQSKRLKIAAAERKHLLVDDSKFGRPALHFLSDLNAFDSVITSAPLHDDHVQLFEDAGVPLEIAQDRRGDDRDLD